jgi:hypothetical protein
MLYPFELRALNNLRASPWPICTQFAPNFRGVAATKRFIAFSDIIGANDYGSGQTPT